MKRIKNLLTVALIFLMVSFINEDINAQDRGKFGLRTGLYTDVGDMFIGAEYLTSISQSFYLNPNVEYIFVPDGSFFTVNMDGHYDFYSSSSIYAWTGAGLGILHLNPDGEADPTTDAAVNLLVGVGFNIDASIIPYIQGKAIVSDNTDFEIGLGLRF